MLITENVSLTPFNTFGVDVSARFFVEAKTLQDLHDALEWGRSNGLRTILLGGGSNIVFTANLDGLVILNVIKGIRIVHQLGSSVHVSVAAGENWHDLVLWAVGNGLGGVENLSFIPGTAGAAPVQNIGAYGCEFKDVCVSVTAIHRVNGELRTFSAEECLFGYRDSFFKQNAEQWAVTEVCIALDSAAPLNTGYGVLAKELDVNNSSPPTYADVAKAVENIRREKLPLPEVLGSAGSFFKNPVVEQTLADALRKRFPDMPVYPVDENQSKLSAAWLMDTAGWKGKRHGDVGTYPMQPLVLVNYGKATGLDILTFSQEIQKDIAQQFGVSLEREAVVYP